MEQLISAVFYSLTAIVLLGIALSYWIAWSMQRSISVFSLLIYFIVTFVLNAVISVSCWADYLDLSMPVPFRGLRAVVIFGAVLFLFYTTWRKE